MNIPFNKPHSTGKESEYILSAIQGGHISGNGIFTKRCQEFLSKKYSFSKCLLTTSCTDALEMSSILCDIQPGDEVIMPAYTFVSTANPFVLRGAKIVFADSLEINPNLDVAKIEGLITEKTKAIVPVHYAGVACDMDPIMVLARKYNLFVIEDAAQAIDGYYKGKPLGGIGNIGAFSFHDTKNIISGEGGALVVNDASLIKRSEIIWEKGTNRAAFFRGEVNKYGWVDAGSSFLPSDMIAAFLFAQLEQLHNIQDKRIKNWNYYHAVLSSLSEQGYFQLPIIPDYATSNAHIFYLLCNSIEERTSLIKSLKAKGVQASFHYLTLHQSEFYTSKHDGRSLPHAERFSDCLLRLPMFYDLNQEDIQYIVNAISSHYKHSA